MGVVIPDAIDHVGDRSDKGFIITARVLGLSSRLRLRDQTVGYVIDTLHDGKFQLDGFINVRTLHTSRRWRPRRDGVGLVMGTNKLVVRRDAVD